MLKQVNYQLILNRLASFKTLTNHNIVASDVIKIH